MKTNIKYLLIAVVIIAVWQYFGSINSLVRLYVSSPSLIVDYFASNHSALLNATFVTFLESLAGLVIATVFSFGLMVICFYKPKFLDFIMPAMVTSQIIPTIVLAPFFVIFFGLGVTSKIVMAAVTCFFPIFVNFVYGYKSISQNIHALMKIHKATLKFKIKNVYFPLSAPSIFTGLKISTPLAVIGAIVAEFTGTNVGIGKNLFVSAIRLEPDLMMSSLILATLIGLGMHGITRLLEVRFVAWR